MTVWDFLGKRILPWDFARHITVIPKGQTLEQWLDQVAGWNSPTSYGFLLVSHPAADHLARGAILR